MATPDSTYRVREFATLAGVSVRALHHYDRLGLLKPQRTNAGYRVYTARDLAALEQIVVLKFIGLSLADIAGVQRHGIDRLAASLRAQRQLLARKRQLLDQAIVAVGELETVVTAGHVPAPDMFRRIMEVIDMNNDSNATKRELDALVNAKLERLQAMAPADLAALRADWRALVGEIAQSLDEDPAGPKARGFVARWTGLLEQLMGRAPLGAALSDHHRTQEWQPQMASFVDKPVWDFMTRALEAARR